MHITGEKWPIIVGRWVVHGLYMDCKLKLHCTHIRVSQAAAEPVHTSDELQAVSHSKRHWEAQETQRLGYQHPPSAGLKRVKSLVLPAKHAVTVDTGPMLGSVARRGTTAEVPTSTFTH